MCVLSCLVLSFLVFSSLVFSCLVFSCLVLLLAWLTACCILGRWPKRILTDHPPTQEEEEAEAKEGIDLNTRMTSPRTDVLRD